MSETKGTGRVCALDEGFGAIYESEAGPFTVWVMGGEARLRLALAAELPERATLGRLGTCLDEAADSLTRELISLDEQVLGCECHRLAWASSLLADRGPYAGDLQINAARYTAMDEIVRAGGRHVFFVDDAIVSRAMAETAKRNGLTLECADGADVAGNTMGVLRARASVLKQYVSQSRVLKKMRKSRPAPWAELARCDVLVLDWVGANSFERDGETARTGNLQRMADVLRQGGLKVGFIANPLSWTQPFEAIAENVVDAHDPVVMTDECRGIWSVLKGAWATWRMSRHVRGATLRAGGLDLSPLFEVERQSDAVRPQSTAAYSYSAIAAVLARHDVKPKAIVYPCENQGWEQALAAGVRRHLPQTRVIACQSAPMAERYISQLPAPSDVKSGRLPDQWVVMGPFYRDLLVKFGLPGAHIVVGGSFRFEAALENPLKPAQGGDGKTVLAATSIEFGEALDLVVKGAAAVLEIPGAHLVVNFHPIVEGEFREGIAEGLRKALGGDAMTQVTLSTQRSSELMDKADVLLYNSSGAVFDACFVGVPVVHVAVDGSLSYDKVPGGTSNRVNGTKELVAMLNEIFSRTERAAPDFSVGGVIAPVDEAAILTAVRGA